VDELLKEIQQALYDKALKHREENTHVAKDWDEFTNIITTKQGFIKAMWCGDTACEEAIKEETGATTRCMPFVQEPLGDVCVHCKKPAKTMVYFGRAY
jgi:prolyl-tRNA synthetase